MIVLLPSHFKLIKKCRNLPHRAPSPIKIERIHYNNLCNFITFTVSTPHILTNLFRVQLWMIKDTGDNLWELEQLQKLLAFTLNKICAWLHYVLLLTCKYFYIENLICQNDNLTKSKCQFVCQICQMDEFLTDSRGVKKSIHFITFWHFN